MSVSQQIINRFSMGVSLKYRQGGKGTLVMQQQPNRILHNLMVDLVDSHSDKTEDDWARHFLKMLIQSPKVYQILWRYKKSENLYATYVFLLFFANLFLIYYLQLTCFYAAREVHKKLMQSPNINLHYPLEDCFMSAIEVALKPASLLRGFAFNSTSSLQTYAQIAISRNIKNKLVRELKSKSIKLSDNGLLRNINQAQLEKALHAYGISTTEIIKYCLAWQTFKDVFAQLYPPTNSDGSRSHKPPTTALNSEQLSQIATRYNQQIQRLKISESKVNVQIIQNMLDTCVQAVRNFQTQRLVSIEESSNFTELSSESVDIMILEEQQQELSKIREVILEKFQEIDVNYQKSILLWLGLEISQNDFLLLLNLSKQYQVTRYFQRCLKKIMKSFTQYYIQNHLNRNPTAKEIEHLCRDNLNEIKEYLSIYSKQYFSEILVQIVPKNISQTDKRRLIQYLDVVNQYIKQRTKDDNIKESLNDARSQAQNSISKIQQQFSRLVEIQLELQLQQFRSAEEKIGIFIDVWLRKNQAVLY
ncbi:MAG: hypothetical protein QNJ47_00775 [Nostocaceae cyanobacterium]|nr:hypothetical protein [Nostocaceae cyanobacterium]